MAEWPRPTPQHSIAPIEADRAPSIVLGGWRDRLRGLLDANLVGVRGVVIAGAASTVVYLLIVLAFPITQWWNQTDQNLGSIPSQVGWARPLLWLGGQRPLNIWMGILTLAVILLLFGLQGLALYAANKHPDVPHLRRTTLLFAGIFIAILIWMQPITSTDLYGYLARSYLIADLHQNPTIHQALLLPGGFQVPKARPPAPYGPLWLIICGVVGDLVGQNLLLGMLLMKLLMAAATLGAIALVAWLADRLLPSQRTHALLFFAWSPLLMLEAVGNGHNDVLMMVAVLGSLAMIALRRPVLAFPLLALGVLIKYSVGALVPLWAVALFFIFCWRPAPASDSDQGRTGSPTPWQAPPGLLSSPWARQSHRAYNLLRQTWGQWLPRIDLRRVIWIFGVGGALSVGIALLCYAPFWVGLKTFTGLGQQLGATYFNGSIAGMVYAALSFGVTGTASASLGSVIRWLLYAIYLGYVLWQAYGLVRRGSLVTVTELAQISGTVIFATLVLVTFWFQPWYIVWLLPLAALAPNAILRRHAATLAFGGVATYIVQYFMFVNQASFTRDFFVQFFLVIVAFSPLLILRHRTGSEAELSPLLIEGQAPQNTITSWFLLLRRSVGESIKFITRRPVMINRLMLGMILVVAAVLRLVRLGSAPATTTLRTISSNLRISVLDTRGLDGPFGILQNLTVALLGPTPFALLLPSALIGTLTVAVIYALALEFFQDRRTGRRQNLALLAALFAATAQWHVALSRAGVQIVLMPLFVGLALLCLWRERRLRLAEQAVPPGTAGHWWQSISQSLALLLIVAGLCIGLVSDMEPGLWPLPVLFLGIMGVVWWRQRRDPTQAAIQFPLLLATTLLCAIPTFWGNLAHYIGFPSGSPFLAHADPRIVRYSPLGSHTLANLGNVLRVLVTQDYGSIGPIAGKVHILPALLIPFFLLGVWIIVRRWRQPEALAMIALALLPLLLTLTAGAPPSVIEAATVLSIACILPALGLESFGFWLATIPEVIAGPTNRVFISRQNILRGSLLLLVIIATVSTYFWFFVQVEP